MSSQDSSSTEVVLLHGIRTTGSFNVLRFEQPLRAAGYSIHPFDLPFTFIREVVFNPGADRRRANDLTDALAGKRPHLIAHSNGARVAALAMAQGARFDTVVFFAPAWSATKRFPKDAFKRLFVIHSRADKALRFGGMIPGHDFGWLGLRGYQGPTDHRIRNVSAGATAHMAYFKGDDWQRWQRFALKALAHQGPLSEPQENLARMHALLRTLDRSRQITGDAPTRPAPSMVW